MDSNSSSQLSVLLSEIKELRAQMLNCKALPSHKAVAERRDGYISVSEFLAMIWRDKLIIVLIVGVFAVASLVYAATCADTYRSSVIVAPSKESQGGGVESGAIGGVAALAGIQLGRGVMNDFDLALKLLESNDFVQAFILKHGIQAEVFASKGWDANGEFFKYDDDRINVVTKKLISQFKSDGGEPSGSELVRAFKKKFSIELDKEKKFVAVSYSSFSPIFSRDVVEWIVSDLNAYMKERAVSEAERNIAYLNQQVEQTAVSEMRDVFFTLIQEQIKSIMLAKTRSEYVFQVVDSARIPDRRVSPNRPLLVLVSILMGFFFACLWSLVRERFVGAK